MESTGATPFETELIPYHEAGHTLLAFISGRFCRVSIGVDAPDWNHTEWLSRDDRCDLTIYLAGIAAQKVRLDEFGFGSAAQLGGSLAGAENDIEEALRIARELYGETTHEEIRKITDHLDAGISKAPGWTVVKAIANTLREERVLLRSDVERVYNQTMAGWRAAGGTFDSDA